MKFWWTQCVYCPGQSCTMSLGSPKSLVCSFVFCPSLPYISKASPPTTSWQIPINLQFPLKLLFSKLVINLLPSPASVVGSQMHLPSFLNYQSKQISQKVLNMQPDDNDGDVDCSDSASYAIFAAACAAHANNDVTSWHVILYLMVSMLESYLRTEVGSSVTYSHLQ